MYLQNAGTGHQFRVDNKDKCHPMYNKYQRQNNQKIIIFIDKVVINRAQPSCEYLEP